MAAAAARGRAGAGAPSSNERAKRQERKKKESRAGSQRAGGRAGGRAAGQGVPLAWESVREPSERLARGLGVPASDPPCGGFASPSAAALRPRSVAAALTAARALSPAAARTRVLSPSRPDPARTGSGRAAQRQPLPLPTHRDTTPRDTTRRGARAGGRACPPHQLLLRPGRTPRPATASLFFPRLINNAKAVAAAGRGAKVRCREGKGHAHPPASTGPGLRSLVCGERACAPALVPVPAPAPAPALAPLFPPTRGPLWTPVPASGSGSARGQSGLELLSSPASSPPQATPAQRPRGLGLPPGLAQSEFCPWLGSWLAGRPRARESLARGGGCSSGPGAPRDLNPDASQDGSRGAAGAALCPSASPPSRPDPTRPADSRVASGGAMVVLAVPAEVTAILLDIEGTTTPIAFVKVRGGRVRRSSCCRSGKSVVSCCFVSLGFGSHPPAPS